MVSLELLHSAVMAAMVVVVDLQAWETTERLPAPVARHVRVMRSGVAQVLPAGLLQRTQPHLSRPAPARSPRCAQRSLPSHQVVMQPLLVESDVVGSAVLRYLVVASFALSARRRSRQILVVSLELLHSAVMAAMVVVVAKSTRAYTHDDGHVGRRAVSANDATTR